MRLINRLSLCLAAVIALGMASAAPAADPQITVTVVDAGAGAKSELRYDLAAGTTQKCVMSTRMSSTQSMSGMTLPSQAIPEMRTPMTATITERVADDARYTTEMGEMEVVDDGSASPEMIQMMRNALKGSGGVKITGLLDPRGTHKEINVVMPPGASPAMEAQLDQSADSMAHMLLPLPAEPVAVGAKWTVEQIIESNGMKITQTTTCTLKDRKGSVLSLDVQIVQKADPQKIQNPAMPPDADIQLQEFNGSGKGTMQVDLNRLLPLASDLESSLTMKMTVEMMGQKQAMEQSMQLKATMKSEDAPAAKPATP